MHNHILQAPLGLEVDHIDGNGLNNRRENLRLASHSQNLANQKRSRIGCSSKYRGVSWFKRTGIWIAQITVRYHHRGLGYFKDEKDAARAYDKAALEAFGEFAVLNFPNKSSNEELAEEE